MQLDRYNPDESVVEYRRFAFTDQHLEQAWININPKPKPEGGDFYYVADPADHFSRLQGWLAQNPLVESDLMGVVARHGLASLGCSYNYVEVAYLARLFAPQRLLLLDQIGTRAEAAKLGFIRLCQRSEVSFDIEGIRYACMDIAHQRIPDPVGLIYSAGVFSDRYYFDDARLSGCAWKNLSLSLADEGVLILGFLHGEFKPFMRQYFEPVADTMPSPRLGVYRKKG